ncbi:MAG: pyruvate formate lyase family protein [Desulfobaccales bacterium]
MRYLNREEQDEAFALRLNEAGAASHNVPDYGRLLRKGVGGLLADVRVRLASATDQGGSGILSVSDLLPGRRTGLPAQLRGTGKEDLGGHAFRLFSRPAITAIDALWAIKDMVFSDDAVFTPAELTQCLICDWGHDMKEPFCSSTMGDDRIAVLAERFKKLRAYALERPKFGQGREQVDRFARRLLRDLIKLAYDVAREKTGLIAARLQDLENRFGTPGQPFAFVITPGIATFEDYAGIGSFLGASADGSLAFQPVASDFSPSPTQPDLPVPGAGRGAEESLKSWAAGAADDRPGVIDPIGIGLSNGSPVDINIREDLPEGELLELIVKFAQGELGPNMMSITCADPDTLTRAQSFPECYDLVRMRMGGWSEFFVAMFPHHQEHHKRRPLFEAKGRSPALRRRA